MLNLDRIHQLAEFDDPEIPPLTAAQAENVARMLKSYEDRLSGLPQEPPGQPARRALD